MAREVMDIEKRNKILNNGKLKLKTYLSVIDEIERGISEAEACRIHNVDVHAFRYFIRKNYEDTSEYKEKQPYEKYFTWQDELFAAIFDNKTTACKGFTEAYEYVKTTLTERESKILDMRYKEGMSLHEVGKVLNTTHEPVREIEKRALRKLRQPDRAKILYYGLEYTKCIEEREKELELKRAEELNKLVSERYEKDKIKYSVLNLPIEEINLSGRAYNCLKRNNINTLNDLIDFSSKNGLSKCKNLGYKSFEDIVDKVDKFGIKLKYKI